MARSAAGRRPRLTDVYLLDTNVVSELRRVKPHGAVLAWLRALPETDIHICAVTIGEIQAGVEKARETDAAKAAEIESWLDGVEKNYSVLTMDARAFRVWARLMHRKSNALMEDAMIAAIAQANGLTVATRNVRDFAGFGVQVVDPFTG